MHPVAVGVDTNIRLNVNVYTFSHYKQAIRSQQNGTQVLDMLFKLSLPYPNQPAVFYIAAFTCNNGIEASLGNPYRRPSAD